MIKQPVTINLTAGLQSRSAATLVQVASQYESEYLLRLVARG